MIVRAKNWRGTAIRAIAGTRGLSGRRRGVGDAAQDAAIAELGPDAYNLLAFGPGYSANASGEVGPNAGTPLQVGNLAQQISSSGQYSINPSTGQLQQNMVPGISNQALIYGGLAALGFVVLLSVMKGGRR